MTCADATAMRDAFARAGLRVFERGWLSSNNILFQGGAGVESVLVDSGYCTHSAQTLNLINEALGQQRLDRIVNTHLHSDHCGGNAGLQQRHGCRIDVPAGDADSVDRWDTASLTYDATQQLCPPFVRTGLLVAGEFVWLGGREWLCVAAPGHDPASVMLFDPQLRILISADALWEDGFGVVFPEIQGRASFHEVEETLDRVQELDPRWVIPGHGRPFGDVSGSLARARQRVQAFRSNPARHARHAAKVLLKFHLLEVQRMGRAQVADWMRCTPHVCLLHHGHFAEQHFDSWTNDLVEELIKAGAAAREGDQLVNR